MIPDVEWWDAYFLPDGKKSFFGSDKDINDDKNKENILKIENFAISEENYKKVKSLKIYYNI